MTDKLVGEWVTLEGIQNTDRLKNDSEFCDLAGFTSPLKPDRLKFRLEENSLKMWDVVKDKQIVGYAGLVYFLGANFAFACVQGKRLQFLESNLRQDILKLLSQAHFAEHSESRLHLFVPKPVPEDFPLELDALGFDMGDDSGTEEGFFMRPETFEMYYKS